MCLFMLLLVIPTLQPTRPDPVDLRRLSCGGAGCGDHPELVGGFGLQGENVSAAGRAGLLLDGAVLIGVALPALEFRSFHLDVEAFDPEQTRGIFLFRLFKT